jgi:hypothetical protein
MEIRGLNKKAEEEMNLLSQILFILLCFGILFAFVYNSIAGVAFYEQIYAKRIALLLESAEPNLSFSLSIEDKVFDYLSDSSIPGVFIDNEGKNVLVGFSSNMKAYSQPFYSSYEFEVVKDLENKRLVIVTKDV